MLVTYTLNIYARPLYITRTILGYWQVSDPDQKHLLEEILGSVREIKAEAAARHLRKATKQHCFSELLVNRYTVDLRC